MTNPLQTFAREWSAEHMSDDERWLIQYATWDLFMGPFTPDEGDATGERLWKGFEVALDTLRHVDIPSRVWVDDDSGCWTTSEPDWEYQKEDGEWHGEMPDAWTVYDRRDIARAIFGRELAEYL